MIQRLINILALIRWKNMLIFLGLQFVVYWRYKEVFYNDNHYLLFNLILVLFAVAGNIQNDIYDIDVDRFNRKSKDNFLVLNHSKTLQNRVLLLYAVGIVLAFVLYTNTKLFWQLSIIPLVLSLYNTHLKRVALIGNIIVSASISYVLYLTFAYFFIPNPFFNFYIIMAFLLNVFREIVKDIQDKKGDKKAGYKTLPIVSIFFTNLAIRFLVLGYIIAVVYYRFSFESTWQSIIIFATILPVLYVVKLVNANKISGASALLKVIMSVGILSILL